MKKENKDLEHYLGCKLRTMAHLKQDNAHEYPAGPLNSAERSAVRAMKELTERGECMREYARCFNTIVIEEREM